MTISKTLVVLSCLLIFACKEESKSIQDLTLDVNIEEPVIDLNILENHASFQQLIDQEKGKVILVNLWATWCKPCKNEMPALEKLHKTFTDKGIKVIAISIDNVNHIDSLLVPYWEKMNFTMDNYVVGGSDPGAFVNTIDPLWLGMIPATFIFDQEGKRVDSFMGSHSYKDFERKVLAVQNKVL